MNDPESKKKERMMRNIVMFIRRLGITSKNKGYFYLIEAVKLKMEQCDHPIMITKDIYPHIAKKYHTSESSIEHGIRLVSKNCWKNHREELKQMSDIRLDKSPSNTVLVDILAFKAASLQENKNQ